MKRRITVAALITYNGKYLFMTQRKEGGIYPNTIHIPGGGMKDGECCEDALRREIMEETGLELKEIKKFDFEDAILQYKGEEWHFIFLRYLVTSTSNKAIPGDDAKELFWLNKEEIPKYNHNPISVTLLKKLGLL